MGEVFDTTGFVLRNGATTQRAEDLIAWSDLTPFQQGYVEALFASLTADLIDRGDCLPALNGQSVSVGLGFSDLSPEALAMILKDCSSMEAIATGFGMKKLDAAKGRNFWNGRQDGGYRLSPVVSVAFPPLRVPLSDDGKIHLQPEEAGR